MSTATGEQRPISELIDGIRATLAHLDTPVPATQVQPATLAGLSLAVVILEALERRDAEASKAWQETLRIHRFCRGALLELDAAHPDYERALQVEREAWYASRVAAGREIEAYETYIAIRDLVQAQAP